MTEKSKGTQQVHWPVNRASSISLAAVAGLQVACAGYDVTRDADLQLSSYCRVVESPGEYDGRVIRLQAKAKPPDHAPLRLQVDECKQTIALDPGSVKNDADFKVLEKSVWLDFPGPSAGVDVDVVGEFRWVEGRKPSRVLVLRKIIRIGEAALDDRTAFRNEN